MSPHRTQGDAPGLGLHATAVVVGDAGVLIRGDSGSGKSTLARALIDAARARGVFARLISDDRVLVSVRHGRLVARVHPRIAGSLEVRGMGIVPVDHAGAAVVRLVVDCGLPPLDRMPRFEQSFADIFGVRVRRIGAGPGDSERVLFALEHPGPAPDAEP